MATATATATAAEYDDADRPQRQRRYEVGYALSPKKQRSFIQNSLLSLASSRGIDLVPVDPSLPLVSQGPFDALIHKLCGPDWRVQLRDLAARYPGTRIIDHPDAIERLHNRLSMLQVVSDLCVDSPPVSPSSTFGIPNQAVIYGPADLPSAAETLKFPMIAKPLVADGSARSHKMALVFTREALLKQKPPLVLQEFVNHGGVIFKVYVVGDHVQCVRRKSLRDVSDEVLDWPSQDGSVSFSQISNVTARSAPGVLEEAAVLEEAEMPPMGFLTDIARGLRKTMGLHLFNFDVIRDIKLGNHYLVVDINYFPGYAKMPSYEMVLTDFLWNIVQRDKKEESAGEILCGGDVKEVDVPGEVLDDDGKATRSVNNNHGENHRMDKCKAEEITEAAAAENPG